MISYRLFFSGDGDTLADELGDVVVVGVGGVVVIVVNFDDFAISAQRRPALGLVVGPAAPPGGVSAFLMEKKLVAV
jgi:hypothetical protein